MYLKNKIKAIAVSTAAVCCTVMLTACGDLTEENAQMLVDEFLQDFKQGKYEEMYPLTHDEHPYFQGLYDESVPTKKALFNKLSEKMEYSIESVQVNGKEAIVNTHISNVDAQAAIDDAAKKYYDRIMEMGEEAVENADTDAILADVIEHCFDAKDAERTEKDTVFNLVAQKGKWKIESNILIYDDITGGYTIPYTWNNLTAIDD